MTKRIGLVTWWGLAALLLLLVSVGAGALVVRNRSLYAELDQARTAFAAGNHALASVRLSRLAERWTNDGEVLLLLGENEMERGRKEPPERRAESLAAGTAALNAWAKVPKTSPYFGRASLLRANYLINIGRYAPVEEVLLTALAEPAVSSRRELERALSRLYRFEGRFDDVRGLIRGSWAHSPAKAADLKELWNLDHAPMPVESWRRALDKAEDSDDRVWLGRAQHSTMIGRFADAARWLDRCAERRPDDLSVWQARLDLAVATNDVARFSQAGAHLPGSRFDAVSVLRFRVWLAGLSGDSGAEQIALEKLVEQDPANARALERLAALMIDAGRAGEGSELHRRKAEIDRAHDDFRKMLMKLTDLSSRAQTLAELTAKLNRRFDTQAWSIIADARASDPETAVSAPGSDADQDASASLLVRPPDQTEAESRHARPWPAELAERAAALSAPYAHPIAVRPPGGPTLADLMGNIDRGPGRVSRESASSRSVSDRGASAGMSPEFVDDAEAVGLRFVFDNGQTRLHLMPETISGGVGLVDFDSDGWLDVFCVQGGMIDLPGAEGKAVPVDGDRLFHNRGDGTFDDVTVASGIAKIAWGRDYGMAVAVGDYDNDGHPDLFVSRLASYALYRNKGDGTFEDVTERAGLAGRRDNPSSAAFADLDGDGDLDLYVCHYMIWDPAHPDLCQNAKGDYVYCDPMKVRPAPDHVFRNDRGRFVDVTASSGCVDTEGRGLGVVAADLDGDDRIDLYVANDGNANYLFRNKGGFLFEDIALQAGVAGSADGGYQAGMGIACGDLDGDGRPELMVTNFYGEGTTLYQNLGDGLFADRSAASGIGLATRFLLGFGIAMADVTNDGSLDVMTANGHVHDSRPFFPYALPSRLYENRPDGRLVDISASAGAPWKVERVGRGLAAGDLDNDGRIDAVILSHNEPVAYFHNKSEGVGHYLTLRLEGTKSNRDAVGARVTVTTKSRRQVAQRQGGGSYQSANDPRLHFGLGKNDRVDSIEIRWPSGKLDRFTDVSADTGYLAREGEAKLLPLRGFAARQSNAKNK